MPQPPRATLNPAMTPGQLRPFRFLTRIQRSIERNHALDLSIGLGMYLLPLLIIVVGGHKLVFGSAREAEAAISNFGVYCLVAIALIPVMVIVARYLSSDPVAQLPPSERILPKELAETEAEHLLTLQEAVDTILESPLHERELLDDATRARVILRDVEWSIARQLLEQSTIRRRIENTPISGPQSQTAADQARAGLARQQRPTIEQIETITEHARHVRAAETQVADAEAARHLSELGSDIAERTGSQSAAEADAASLASLRLAKESARRIAALAPETQPGNQT